MANQRETIVEATTIKADISSSKHRDDIQSLFGEYAAISGSIIDDNVAGKLFELSYFKGFICYKNDEPLGFAVCFESFSSYKCKQVLNIHDFMISASYRGKGYGRILMDAIEQFGKDNDYLKLTLEVNESNSNDKKLYASFGFEDYRVALNDQLHWQKYLPN